MANWYLLPDGAGSRNGTNWANAWRMTDINWSNVGTTDTLFLGAGTYTDPIEPKKSGSSQSNPLTISASTDATYGGRVIIYGGRTIPLLASKKSGSTGGGTDHEGIFLGSYANIKIDGLEIGGITIHGWNRDGVKMWTNNPGGHTLKNLWIYDNGSTDSSSVYEDGIAICGSNNLIEDCVILDNRADAIQGISGGTVSNLTVRRCLLGNTRSHPDNPALMWNYLAHPDGLQMPDGASNITMTDCVMINCWHGLIPDETDGNTSNSSFERLTFINCGTAIRHKHNSSDNNVYRDWVVKKWGWYPKDDGIGYAGGTNFRIKGENHTFERIYTAGGGAFVNETSNSTFSNMYHDNNQVDPIPNSSTISDPQFDNAGPYGTSSGNIAHDWDKRSLKSGNATISAFNNPYSGPLDFFNQVSGVDYTVFPQKPSANEPNAPYFKSLATQSVGAGVSVSYQVAADHPDGSTINYSVAGPSWLSISSTGLLSGSTSSEGTYKATVSLSSSGGTAHAKITVIVGSGGGGGSAPQFANPGTLNHIRGDDVTYQVVASDPDGDSLTYTATGLPLGLNLNSSTGIISGIPSDIDSYSCSITVTDGTTPIQQDFTWHITGEGESGSTTLYAVETQKLSVGDSFSVQIVSSTAISLGGTASSTPSWVSLAIVQPEELPVDTSNNAPVLGSIGAQAATVGTPYSLQLSATDADSGDTLTYSVTSGTLPAGITLTAAGLLSGTPTAAVTPSITIQVSDGNGGTDDETFVFTVSAANSAPVLGAIGDQTSTDGDTISLQLSATDADSGDTLTYSISVGTLPSGLSLNSSTGLISGDVDTVESQTFTVQVSDGTATDTEEITWTVSAANSAPVLASIGDQTNDDGDVVSLTVSATDADSGDTLTYSVSAGTLPSGLSLNSSTGLISGTLDTVETQTLTIQVSDGTATDTEEITWTVSAAASPVTINLAVSSGNGDGDSQSDGTNVNLTRTTLTLQSAGVPWLAFHFENVAIPQGKTITAADFQAYINASGSRNDPNVKLYAEDIDDSPALSTTNGDFTNRTLTTAFVTWVETDLTAGFQSAPDMAAVIQEVVNRSGWASGNDITIMMEWQSSNVRFRSYDNNSSYGAKLDITYQP